MVVFLYAPIVILLDLLVQRLAAAVVPAQRVHAPLVPPVPRQRRPARRRWRRARSSPRSRASAPSLLGVLASIALVRRRFRGKSAVSALLLSPLVIPYVVFGISLLLLFHTLGIPRSILTVVIGHIVISLPYTILVLDAAARSRSTSRSRRRRTTSARAGCATFRSITLPLILPAVVSAFLIAFTTSFDEYAVASFVVGTAHDVPDLPLLGAALPEPAAAGDRGRGRRDLVSLIVVVAAEVGPADRRAAARARLDAADGVLRAAQVERHVRARLEPASDSSARRWLTIRPGRRVDVELRVHPEVDDLRDRAARDASRRPARPRPRPELYVLGPHRDAHRVAGLRCPCRGDDHALAVAEPRHRVVADELVDRSARSRSASR